MRMHMPLKLECGSKFVWDKITDSLLIISGRKKLLQAKNDTKMTNIVRRYLWQVTSSAPEKEKWQNPFRKKENGHMTALK